VKVKVSEGEILTFGQHLFFSQSNELNLNFLFDSNNFTN